MIIYDETLEAELVKNNFSVGSIKVLCDYFHMENLLIDDIINKIIDINLIYKTRTGCVFTLPTGRVDKKYIFATELHSDEIRRLITLKAFL